MSELSAGLEVPTALGTELLEGFVPELKVEGIDDEVIHQLSVENPARLMTQRQPALA